MLRAGAGIAMLVLGATLLAGCSETQGDVGNRNIRPNSVLTDGNGNKVIDKRFANDPFNEQNRVYGRQLNSNNLIGRHQNYRLEMGQEIADAIAGAEGLERVTVILTDRNAYVAVSDGGGADDGESGTRTRGRGEAGDKEKAGSNHDRTGIAYPRMNGAIDPGRDIDPLQNGMGMRSSRTDSREGLPAAGGSRKRGGSS